MTGGWRILLCLAAATAAAMSGCSGPPKTAPVQGKVVLNKGKPLANAAVQFIPDAPEGNIANGTTDADGSFRLQTYFAAKRVAQEGAVPGKYKVIITPYPRGPKIAVKYGSLKDTPLAVEVPEGGLSNLTLEVMPGQ